MCKKMPDSRKKTLVLVCGCPRSGTSFVAGELKRLKLQSTLPENQSLGNYPGGVNEDIRVDLFFASIERYQMATTRDGSMKAFSNDEIISPDILCEELVKEIYASTLAKAIDEAEDFLKFPQILLATRLFETVVERPIFLVVWRSHSSNIVSLSNREFSNWCFPFRKFRGHLLWLKYANIALKLKEERPDNCILLNVSKVKSTGDVLKALASHGVSIPPSGWEAEESYPPKEKNAVYRLLIFLFFAAVQPFVLYFCFKRGFRYASTRKLEKQLSERSSN